MVEELKSLGMAEIKLQGMPESLKPKIKQIRDSTGNVIGTETIAAPYATLDAIFEDMIKSSKWTFKFIANINAILVGLGIFLLLWTIVYSWFKGTDLTTVITGLGGLGVIVTNFFVAPQTHITQSLGDKGQIQMIYKTYHTQSEIMQAYIRQMDNSNLAQMTMLLDILQNYTEKSVRLIEECMKPMQTSETKPPASGGS